MKINLSLYGRASPSSPIHQLSARRKMKLFSKGTYGRLKELLEGLREQNSLLERCLGILDRKPTDHIVMPAQQQPSIASAIPTSPPKATETPTSTTVINPEFRPDKAEDPPEETVQQSSLSTMLYRALAKAPLCKCHLLYLRLESHSCSQLDPSRTIGFSMLVTSSNVSETRVSVNPSPKTSGDLFLEIMNDLTNDKGKSSQLCTGNLCDTLFGSSQDQVSYLLDNFLVKRVRNSQKYTTTGCTALSLHDLIEDKRGVTHYDRLILSAKLGKAAISLHSSPWTKGWSTRTIKFFAEYEESSQPASWKPHISTTFNSDYIVLPSNTDVYALGMMLLEIGDADTEHFEYPQMLKPALRTITMQMGRPYRKIVERCFNTYQDSVTMDNSDDSNINALRTEIEELESYVTSCFNF